jgi:hypothetical protein
MPARAARVLLLPVIPFVINLKPDMPCFPQLLAGNSGIPFFSR